MTGERETNIKTSGVFILPTQTNNIHTRAYRYPYAYKKTPMQAYADMHTRVHPAAAAAVMVRRRAGGICRLCRVCARVPRLLGRIGRLLGRIGARVRPAFHVATMGWISARIRRRCARVRPHAPVGGRIHPAAAAVHPRLA